MKDLVISNMYLVLTLGGPMASLIFSCIAWRRGPTLICTISLGKNGIGKKEKWVILFQQDSNFLRKVNVIVNNISNAMG